MPAIAIIEHFREVTTVTPPAPARASADAKESNPIRARSIRPICAIASIGYFLISAARHFYFRSGQMDLGFFDQLVYLISRGQTPISSVSMHHGLADHASVILYLLAPLYWIAPSAYTLLAVQAIALAGTAYPLWRIARERGINESKSLAIAIVYLLFPLTLTANVSDFHPETLAVPAIAFAVLFGQRGRIVPFLACVLLAMLTKEIVALTIVAMGFWLIAFERRRAIGIAAIILAGAWFLFATRWIIPHFGDGKEASGVRLFAYLGASVAQIAIGLFTHPQLWIQNVCRLAVVVYLAILFGPVIGAISLRRLWPLLGAMPTILLNVLADPSTGENLLSPISQYSLLAVPFVMLAAIWGVSSNASFFKRPRTFIAWSIAILLAGVGVNAKKLARRDSIDPADSIHAMSLIPSDAALLTTHEIAPHLSHRRMIEFIGPIYYTAPASHFDFVLIDHRARSVVDTPELVASVERDLSSGEFGKFEVIFQHGNVVLYHRLEPAIDPNWKAIRRPPRSLSDVLKEQAAAR